MATVDKVVDQVVAPNEVPSDPNVIEPRHVREARELAESYYKPPEETPEQKAAATAAAEEAARAAAAPQDVQNPPPQNQTQPQTVAVPTAQDLQDDSWAGRYNSMRGRWESTQRQLGSLQEQLIAAGDEIGRLNQLLVRAGVEPGAQPQNNPQNHSNVITEQDRDTYGEELIETMARVAKGTVQPELDRLTAENAELKKKTITNDQKVLRQQLQQAVPNWLAIQASPQWRDWLRLPNVYTGVLRGKMLKEAYDAANSAVVIQTFQDFVKEVQATGGNVPTNQRQDVQPAAVPRTPAMSLEDLAAPGRAKPAGGDNPTGSADKPIITRQDIAKHYSDSRKGLYAGREAEYARVERIIQDAQRDGRVRG
jgi:hypothetical protein